MTSIEVVAPPQDVLAWSRAMVDAPRKAAFATLPGETREVVEYHRPDFTTAALVSHSSSLVVVLHRQEPRPIVMPLRNSRYVFSS